MALSILNISALTVWKATAVRNLVGCNRFALEDGMLLSRKSNANYSAVCQAACIFIRKPRRAVSESSQALPKPKPKTKASSRKQQQNYNNNNNNINWSSNIGSSIDNNNSNITCFQFGFLCNSQCTLQRRITRLTTKARKAAATSAAPPASTLAFLPFTFCIDKHDLFCVWLQVQWRHQSQWQNCVHAAYTWFIFRIRRVVLKLQQLIFILYFMYVYGVGRVSS